VTRPGRRSSEPGQAALQLTLPFFQPPPPPPPAGRSINLEGELIGYWLRRTKRRTIGFTIDERGLGVTIPRWVTKAETEAAIREKSRWITRQLARWREQSEQRSQLATRWEAGGRVRVFGTERVLALDEQARGVTLDGDRIVVGMSPEAGAERLRNRVHGWLQEQARAYFASRVPVFSARLGKAPQRWALSSARTRWGSCTRDGSIRLNWRLIHFRTDVIDYVIAHEIAHLRELNHSARFWATVSDLFPDFETVRAELRAASDTSAAD